jgi:CO/xanthine dehydrogenase FAD-binding subunit
VSIARPTDLDGALAALAERPDANLLAGGTDLQVEINLGHRRPDAIVALRRVEELRVHEASNGTIELGAGVTYGTIERDLADLVPGLAMASRTVGSPQIRNAGTIGGNLGTSSPAGDCLPWLAALDAEVVLVSAADGERVLPIADFITGPKRNARRDDELIRAVRVPASPARSTWRRSARATRWSSRSRRSPSWSTPTTGVSGSAWGRSAPSPCARPQPKTSPATRSTGTR